MNIVIKKILDDELAKAHGSDVNLLSREVLLDFKYLNFRTLSGRIIGGKTSMSSGEYIVHRVLGDNEREHIFTSPYDLGNFTMLTTSQARQSKIEDYLGTLEPSTIHESSKKEAIRNIDGVIKDLKHVIRDLTGYDYISYTRECIDSADTQLNTSYATKVLCTLYRYRLEWPKVFDRFSQPRSPKKANLELRDAYPLPEYDNIPQKGVSIYSDLKSSLTHGMCGEERDKLLLMMQKVSERYAASIFISTQSLMHHGVNGILNQLMLESIHIEQELPLGNRTLPERLDKSVYIWLVLREIEHRAVGKQFINDFLASDKGSAPQMSNWSKKAFDAIFMAISQTDINGFRGAIREITGYNYTDDEFELANELHNCLIWVVKSPLEDDPRYNHLEAVAAIITCLGYEVEKIKCNAYWYGKTTTSDRPVYYLKTLQGFESVKRTPEFYLEYWFRRYTLVLSRLVGDERIWHQYNQIEQFEHERVTKVFETHSFNKAIELVSDYYDVEKWPRSLRR